MPCKDGKWEAGIDIAHIYESLREGILTKEAHGLFSLTKNLPDEFRLLQCRSEKIVFSYATALYLQGMSDHVPHVMDIIYWWENLQLKHIRICLR